MAEVVKSFWKGKKVFLTGHTGFKGTWVSLWLLEMGAEVVGYSLAPDTNPSLFEVTKLGSKMKSIIADIRDLESLKSALIAAKPEIVIHMAAQPLVRLSYSIPVETYATNVMGTVHLLEAVRSTPSVRATVIVTTDKCYENQERLEGYREDEAMGGYDPYSSSKGCAELVTAAYRRSFFRDTPCAVASARAGNVIGGGDWAMDRLIPDIMRSIVKNEKVQVRNPRAIRPWQHVLEPLSGYLVLAQSLYLKGQDKDQTYAQAFNFGPEESDAKEVEWIVSRLVEKWGEGADYEILNRDGVAPHEAKFLKLDISKAKRVLNWSPKWNNEKALDQIVEWHKAFKDDKADMTKMCLKQIEEYQKS